MVILPDTSFQSLTFIINTLYSDIPVEVPDNVTMEDLEDTAKLMRLKIPTPNIQNLQSTEETGEVPTLDENIFKEFTDIEMSNVEVSKAYIEKDGGQNNIEPSIDGKETEDITTLDESINVEPYDVEMIKIQMPGTEGNFTDERSISVSSFNETEQYINIFILEMLREEINKALSNVHLKESSHSLNFSPPIDKIIKEIEADKQANLEPLSVEYEMTSVACVSEMREGTKGTSSSNLYKLTWFPDEEIEMIEDNFVEKAITHIPLPSKPKKSLSSKKKDKNAGKESIIASHNVPNWKKEEKCPSSDSKMEPRETSTKMEGTVVKILNEDITLKESDLTTPESSRKADDFEATTANPPKKPKISLVSLSKLLAVPTEGDPLYSSDVNIQTLEIQLPALSTGEISENIADIEENVHEEIISNVPIHDESNSNSTNTAPADSAIMITSAAKKRKIEDLWKVNKSESRECQKKFNDRRETEEANNPLQTSVTDLKPIQEPVTENITVKADPSDFFTDAPIHLNETTAENLDTPKGNVEENPLTDSNSTKQTNLTNNIPDIPLTSISESPNASKPATPVLVKEEHASPKADHAPLSENQALPQKDIVISGEQACQQNDSLTIQKPANIHCDLCLESFSLKIDLARHYSKVHFKTELAESLPEFFPSGDICVQCKETINEANEDKLEHIGQKHKKVFFVMKGKGMDVIELFRENRIRKYKPPPPSETLKVVKNKTTNSPKIKSMTKTRSNTAKAINIDDKQTKNIPSTGVLHDFPVGCEKCNLRFSSGPQLLKHYSLVHFFAQLKAKVPEFFTKANKCKKCGHSILSEKDKVAHIGFKHDKVKDLLLKVDSTAPVKAKSPVVGSKTLPVLPTSKVPVILHGTTKIVFEADKPPTYKSQDFKRMNVCQDNKKKNEAPSGVKFFKLSPSVHCKMVEEKDPLALPSPPKIPEMKGIKITHTIQNDNQQPPPRSLPTENILHKEPDLLENEKNIPEKEPVENEKINHEHDDQNNELIRDEHGLNEKHELKDDNRDESKNVKDVMDENEDESIARALAESLNTFESETKCNDLEGDSQSNKDSTVETETIISKNNLMKNTSANSNSKEDEVEGQSDEFFRVKRNARNANEPRNFKCTICPKRYTNNPHLNDHYTGFHFKDELCLKYGNPDESLTCIFCGKVCMNKVKYAMHVGNVHRKLEEFGIKFKNSNPKRPRSSLGTLVKNTSV